VIGWGAVFIGVAVVMMTAVVTAGFCFDEVGMLKNNHFQAAGYAIAGVAASALAVLLAAADLIILASFALVVWNHL
jgi:hypothetical protein